MAIGQPYAPACSRVIPSFFGVAALRCRAGAAKPAAHCPGSGDVVRQGFAELVRIVVGDDDLIVSTVCAVVPKFMSARRYTQLVGYPLRTLLLDLLAN